MSWLFCTSWLTMKADMLFISMVMTFDNRNWSLWHVCYDATWAHFILWRLYSCRIDLAKKEGWQLMWFDFQFFFHSLKVQLLTEDISYWLESWFLFISSWCFPCESWNSFPKTICSGKSDIWIQICLWLKQLCKNI